MRDSNPTARAAPPNNPGATARRHDVKESNPLDGSFGGSPVTVTYVVSRLPRGLVILHPSDARVNLLAHSFFSSVSFSLY
jgi:hypothetical protein